jgi:hypothetical protein
MWLPNEKHFTLQAGGILYEPIEFQKQLRIKELEYTYNLNDDNRIGYYGAYKYYSGSLEDKSTAGETYTNVTWLRGGTSNAVDGYIVYEVPSYVKDEELIIHGIFYDFGNANWVLKPIN